MLTTWQPLIIRYETCASTNDEALAQARRGAAEGVCVVAAAQTAGRGRQQRAWSSPPGAGLYLSIVTRPQLDAQYWPLLTLAASLAVHDALAAVCGLRADLKWPNDVHADGRKICGILAETCDTPQGRACVTGLGLNLRARVWPPELNGQAVALEELTQSPPDTELILTALLRAFGHRYAALHEPTGPARLPGEWAAASSYALGRRVRVECGTETLYGVTDGLAEDGALRLRAADGTLHVLRAGDLSAATGGLRADTN